MAIDLQRTLSELGDLVPVVAPRVSELMERSEALRRHAQEALDRAGKLPEAMEELAETLEETAREGLEAMREADEDYRERLHGLEEASSQLSASLEDWAAGLEEATAGAREHLSHLERAFAADGKITAREHESAEAVQADGSRHVAAAERMQALQEALREGQARLAARIEASTASLGSALAALAESIQEGRQDVEDGVQGLRDSVGEAREAFSSELQSVSESMQDELADAAEEFRRRVAEEQGREVEERLKVSWGHAVSGEATVRGSVAGVDVSVHVALSAPFDALSALTHPVESAIDAVRSAASLVGLHLG